MLNNCQFCGRVAPEIRNYDEVFKWYECPKCHRRSKIFAFWQDSDQITITKRLVDDWNNRNCIINSSKGV